MGGRNPNLCSVLCCNLNFNLGVKPMDKQQREAQQAFNDAIEAIKYDYMYMGTETDSEHGYQYILLKHIETRDYIKIPKTMFNIRNQTND